MTSRWAPAIVGCALGALLTACAGASASNPPNSSSSPTPRSSVVIIATTTPTPIPAASLQSIWCGISLGQGKTSVEALMGTSDSAMTQEAGQIIDSEQSLLPTGVTAEVWSASNGDSFWATFDGSGTVIELQAYTSGSITQPATDLTCQAFRNNS